MSNSIPGLILPTQKGMLAGNPRDSAIAEMNNTNLKQASLNSSVGGNNKFKKRGGTIAVPQYNMLYSVQNGPGSDPNSQIQTNARISTQGASNSVYDNEATKMGGKRTKRNRKHPHKAKLYWNTKIKRTKTRRTKTRRTRRYH
jgi:hypothetical protein